MDAPNLRPRMVFFRVLEFHTKNARPDVGRVEMGFEVKPEIELALRSPNQSDGTFEAAVKIQLHGRAASKESPDETMADFSAVYEALFRYPPGVPETEVSPRFEREPHQYMLVSQAFPLAISHFRQELSAMGFNFEGLPLGI